MAARGLSCLLRRTLTQGSFRSPLNSRGIVTGLVSEHTAKWMQDTSKKSPMELINEVPPIKVKGRIVACVGGTIIHTQISDLVLDFAQKSLSLLALTFSPQNATCHHNFLGFLTADNEASLGHPIEFICLDSSEPAVCKYCGLRYSQDHHH